MMPYAKGGQRQVVRLRRQGQRDAIDYRKMMKIVDDAGYRYIGIEYEGDSHDRARRHSATKVILERIRSGKA